MISSQIRHRFWVRSSHWIITVSFLALAFTGIEMIMVHPRFYWGEVGNELTPALFELPIGPNYRHGGWTKSESFFDINGSPVSAVRTHFMFNQNGWGRSLHFLGAWFLVVTGIVYLFAGFFTGHFRKRVWPNRKELSSRLFWADFISHLRMQITFGSQYGLLQKSAYSIIIFFLFPLIVMTGLTMSPAITAAYPFLLKIFFGLQSARTIHLLASFALELFLIVHLVMVIKSGFKQQMRAMTIGK